MRSAWADDTINTHTSPGKIWLQEGKCVIFAPSHKKDMEATHMIGAEAPGFRYTGRVDLRDPARPTFDWPGVHIEVRFQGPRCAVLFEDAGNTYNVVIDGLHHMVLAPSPVQVVYPIAEGLADGPHTLLLYKRTEANTPPATFLGVLLAPGKTLLPLPPPSSRRLLFLGDSVVAGYGNEAAGPEAPFSAANTNAYLAFGPVLARRLDAAHHLVAISGSGVVRNYGAPQRRTPDPFPVFAGQTCKADADLQWVPSAWYPDAVIVRLGRNDFSTRPRPWGWVFRRHMRRFLERLQQAYTGVPIFCLTVPRIGDPHHRHIQRVVEGLPNVNVVPLRLALDRPADFGSDWHPNVRGHQKIADAVEPILRDRLGWT